MVSQPDIEILYLHTANRSLSLKCQIEIFIMRDISHKIYEQGILVLGPHTQVQHTSRWPVIKKIMLLSHHLSPLEYTAVGNLSCHPHCVGKAMPETCMWTLNLTQDAYILTSVSAPKYKIPHEKRPLVTQKCFEEALQTCQNS